MRITKWRLACLLVLLAAGIAYLPSLPGKFFWDDVALVGGEGIGGGSLQHCFTRPFLRYYYRPMVSVSFALENPIAGFNPVCYHQTNMLLHILATAWLIRVLRQAFRQKPVALLGGLFFALQPAQVGGVAWIGGRTDALCGLFMLAFADGLLRGSTSVGRARTGYLAFAAVAYALALLTKEQMIGALPLIPLAFRLFLPEGEAAGRRAGWREAVPFFCVALAFVALMACYGPPLSKAPLGQTNPLLSAPRSILYYTLLLLAPTPQGMHTLSLSAFTPLGWWVLPIGAGIVIAVIALFLRLLRTAPAAAWFLAWTVCLGLPVSNIVPLPSILVAPYRIAVAGIGIAVLLGWLLGNGTQKLERRHIPTGRLAIAGGLTVWYFALTFWGAGMWRDGGTFFGAVVKYDPGCVSAHSNLSAAFREAKQPRKARQQMETLLMQLFGPTHWQTPETVEYVIQTDPELMTKVEETQGGRTPLRERLARFYALLGAACQQEKDMEGARRAYQIGCALDAQNATINAALGAMEQQAGHLPEAIHHLRFGVQAEGEEAEKENIAPRVMLCQCLMAAGRWRQAAQEWTACIRLDPNNQGIYYLPLARAQLHLGEKATAQFTLKIALQTPMKRVAIRALADLQQGASGNKFPF